MIRNETKCVFSERVADNLVVDDGFPDLQFPNTNNFFRQHLNSPSLLMNVISFCVEEYRDRCPSLRKFETRSLPALARCFPRSFTFYVADPINFIRKKNEPVSGPLLH
jgi:hypothetical protein